MQTILKCEELRRAVFFFSKAKMSVAGFLNNIFICNQRVYPQQTKNINGYLSYPTVNLWKPARGFDIQNLKFIILKHNLL